MYASLGHTHLSSTDPLSHSESGANSVVSQVEPRDSVAARLRFRISTQLESPSTLVKGEGMSKDYTESKNDEGTSSSGIPTLAFWSPYEERRTDEDEAKFKPGSASVGIQSLGSRSRIS